MRKPPKANKTPMKYPFDVHGQLLSYIDRWTKDITERSAEESRFTGELTYRCTSRGRSSTNMYFTDNSGRHVQFFYSSFDDLISRMVNGKFTATFEPVKMGSNYAWRVVE